MTDTIFALSSGAAPAAIAVIRISGPAASEALCRLTGRLPPPRRAVHAQLRDADAALIDSALVLWLPGPNNATGEDTAELHCHGGRAVIFAVEAALGAIPGLRPATAGEFTRRAFANGRIDLAEAEGRRTCSPPKPSSSAAVR
jgi:tRNA modification GTPase